MAKQKDLEIERRDPPPVNERHGSWAQILTPLVKQPGIWFMIKSCDNEGIAENAQSNLTGRKVAFPHQDHDWVFAARGVELFAIYHGKRRPGVRKPRTR